MADAARVDSWLWAIRVYKTRSAATTACRAGHVRVNGDKVKAAQHVRIGDELRVRIAGFDRILVVRQLLVKRVGAPLAAHVDGPLLLTGRERLSAWTEPQLRECLTLIKDTLISLD